MGSLSEEIRTEVLCGHICDFEAKNAKLRELVRHMHVCIQHNDYGCATCEYWDKVCDFEHDMRELGMELE